MFQLDPVSRALLASAALACFAGAFVTTPIVARSASARTIPPMHAEIREPARATAEPIFPRRDPFAGAPPLRHAAALNTKIAAALLPVPSIPSALMALPPNAGAAGTPVSLPTAARVTAIISGRKPLALVDRAGTSDIIRVGDRLDGDVVVAIDSSGVHLARGTTLAVASR